MLLLSVGLSVAEDLNTEKEQEEYLIKFRYMGDFSQDPRISEMVNKEDIFKNAVENFQMMAGLNQTGEVDEETKTYMRMPRCGMFDQIKEDAYTKRRKRYALGGSRWDKKALTYTFKSYTQQLKNGQIERIMRDAFNQWQINSGLTFTKVNSPKADIIISFVRRDHGDGNPFDGPGQVLAHAFYPSPGIGGDAHFDDDETWSDKSREGTNFFQVAVHELGHSLGLSHSKVKGAIMQAFYGGYIPNAKLHYDDINGIQALYGRPRQGPNTTPTKGKTTKKPPINPRSSGHYYLCQIKKVDAITSVGDKIMVFSGSKFFLMNKYGHSIRNVEMVENRNMFLNLPNGPVQFAIIDTDRYSRKIFLKIYTKNKVTKYSLNLRASQYYNYVSLMNGYPVRDSQEVVRFPSGVTAGFKWKQNGHYYYFKGNKYYRQLSYNKWIDRGYPRNMAIWRGVPNNVDAVFSYSPSNSDNSATFFFKGNKVYNFDEAIARVNTRFDTTLSTFFGCEAPRMGSLEEWNSSPKCMHASHALFILTIFTAIYVSLMH